MKLKTRLECRGGPLDGDWLELQSEPVIYPADRVPPWWLRDQTKRDLIHEHRAPIADGEYRVVVEFAATYYAWHPYTAEDTMRAPTPDPVTITNREPEPGLTAYLVIAVYTALTVSVLVAVGVVARWLLTGRPFA